MPIDAGTPFSDGWWLRRLHKSFNERPKPDPARIRQSRRHLFTRREWLDLLWSYYTGEAPLPRVSEKHRETTREFLRMARANYGTLAVEALLERTILVGVRTGADNDANGDDIVRRIHGANGAWLQDTLAFTYTLGEGFVFVGPGDREDTALITAEDPRQVAVARDPVRPHVARAAVKLYRDEDAGTDVAHLFLPADPESEDDAGQQDRVRVAVKGGSAGGTRFVPSSWEWDNDRSGPLRVQGFGVPVVPYRNRLGMGEFEPHIDLLDRINNMIADRLWTAKLQAFRQRATKGDLPDTDPATGEKIDYDEIFEADPGALWQLPTGIDIWESNVVDLTPILLSVRDDVKEFSAVSRTPLTMFTPDAANGSAEGASLMREGLVFKGEDRTTRLAPAALQTVRLALAYSGQEALAKDTALEAMWAPIERYSLAQRGQAATAGKASGVPFESIMSELWQFGPETVARMQSQRGADLLFQEPGQPVAPVIPPLPPAGG